MTATFLVEIDIEDDTDILGIAMDLEETLAEHFEYQTISVKPWKRETLSTPAGVIPSAALPL